MQTLQITGSDAATFLQGQCTCDINTLHHQPVFAACCNQKGRIVANFWIWQEAPDVFYLQLPKSMVGVLQAHFHKYAIFSKVVIEPIEKARPEVNIDCQPLWIYPETSEQFTPQMIDLQKLGGVSFTKGCYLGQEIIARTEHLGTLKRHCYRIQLSTETEVNPGDAIMNAQQQKLGTVLEIYNHQVFAVLEDRAIEENLFCNETMIDKVTRYSLEK